MDPNLPTSRPAPPARRKGRTSTAPTDTPPSASQDNPVGDHLQLPQHTSADSSATPAPTSSTLNHDVDSAGRASQEMDDGLKGLSKDNLVIALHRAKVEMDRLESLTASQTLEIETLQSASSDLSHRLLSADTESNRLRQTLSQRESRIDELAREQAKMEDEVYSKLGVVERLKSKADEEERRRLEAERKLADVMQMAEKDREYLQDQEAHLKAANARLVAEVKAIKQERAHLSETLQSVMDEKDPQTSQHDPLQKGTFHSPQLTANAFEPEGSQNSSATQNESAASKDLKQMAAQHSIDDVSLLEGELDQLRKTLNSQDAALSELRAKLSDERSRCVELEEEKNELESLLTGNTLEHLMKNKAADQWPPTRYSETMSSHSSRSQEDTGSSSFERQTASSDDIDDDVPDVPSSDVPATPRPRRSRSPHSLTSSRLEPFSNEQLPDRLANELAGDSELRVPHPIPATKIQAMQEELSQLRQENKRLSMYITKILNRIMAMEGFERVLAADSLSSDGTRTLRGSKSRPSTSKTSILPPPPPANDKPAAVDVKKERRRSSGILGISRARSPLLTIPSSQEDALSISPTPSNASHGSIPPQQQAASRTSSVDWKNLRLPWSGPAEEKVNPNLRPFALSTSSSRLEGPYPENKGTSPRLPDLQEELGDDSDEVERQRARALLQMEGLTVPPHQLNPVSPVTRPPAAPSQGGFTNFVARMMSSEPSIWSTPIGASTKKEEDQEGGDQMVDHSASAVSSSSQPHQPSPRLDGLGVRLTQSPGGSRTNSIAGDESYIVDASEETEKERGVTEGGTPGWRKALKRMSILGGGAEAAGSEAKNT